ncbi:MAG: sulfatase, partial [Candidatus Bipolaricaulia bacterium]
VLILLGALAFYFIRARRDGSVHQDKRHRFNVLLIAADAMRPDYLGCYGGEAATPNIDRLAGGGVLFENAYSVASWTAPSAVAIFTGNHPAAYGWAPYERTLKIYVPDGETLLAEALKEFGYRRAMRIENVQATLHNCLQGFSPLGTLADARRAGSLEVSGFIAAITGRKRFNSYELMSCASVLSYILGTPPGARFFLAYWMLDPHEPYQPPPKLLARIPVDETKLTRPLRFYSSRKNIKGPLNEEEEEFIRKLYIAEIESVDERVGFLVEALRRRGIFDSTYVILTSDHGERFGEHKGYGHGAFGRGAGFSETLIKVPLIISGPDLPRGKRVRESAALIDLMPTIKELLAVEYESDMQGRSLLRLIKSEREEERPVYLVSMQEQGRREALIRRPYKLILRGNGQLELYDLDRDPGEREDISSSHQDVVAALSRLAARIREENRARRRANIEALEAGEKPLSSAERRELQKKLRALGYVE